MIGSIQGSSCYLKKHMHLMSSSLPTVWVASILWINEEILRATSQLYVQSALTWGQFLCFFLFATRHPLYASPMYSWGQVLQRSWCSLCASGALAELITGRVLRIAGVWHGGCCPQLTSVASGFLHNAFSYRSFGMWPICPVDRSLVPGLLVWGRV